jgi:PAS domain S-box-containing protein
VGLGGERPFGDWLGGGGEMGERICSLDWSKTPLGSLDQWPQSLRSALSICLGSRFPIVIYWGSEFITLYNDAYAPILAGKHPRALGQPCREVWGEIWDVIGPMLQSVVATSEATWSDNQLLILQRNGFAEECYFSFSFSPVRSEDNCVGGVFTAVIEHTQRVVGERRIIALQELGARATEVRTAEGACAIACETLAKHAKDIPFALLYLIDGDGKRARLVGAAGVAAGNCIARPIIDLAADERRWPVKKVTDVMQVVEDLARRFGSAVPPGPWSDPPRQAVVVPIRSNIAHRLAGFLVAGVSVRLKLDQLYLSFYELLGSQIATAIANTRAYEEERKRAEALAEIDRSKTAFFTTVSHEFRTPLTLLLGPLEDTLAQSNELSAADRERLETAQRNSLRLLKLVNTLLDFSRIEAGRIVASYEPTDVSALTAELASVFRSAIERAGMKLIIDCPPLAEAVYVDREMWEKIVLNLVSNAFKFTFDGEIEVSLRQVDAAIELAVRDTGTGIPPEEMPRLFERFHRVKGARGRSHEGSGIGLSLVQELVTLHGGSVRVESEVDRGSRFIVSIPHGKAHLPADRIEAAPMLASTSIRSEAYVEEAMGWLPDPGNTETTHKLADQPPKVLRTENLGSPSRVEPSTGTRILLADDNADMREYVRRLLTQRGYEVEAVADGMAALRAARERAPDLVLTDVMMPELDGFGLLCELRADPRLRIVPIILLSARAAEEARIGAMHAGADDYLIKPFSARELLARIDAHLRMARIRHEASEAIKRLAAIVESSDDAIVTTDLNGIVASWNDGAERIFGYTADEMIGRSITMLIPSDRNNEEVEILARIRGGERIHHYETARRRKDGGLADISLTVSPVKDAVGEVVGASKIARDISDKKQAQARQDLLTRENQHRTRNLFALVQTIVSNSFVGKMSVKDAERVVLSRLASLGKTHFMLIDSEWQGADLAEIVRSEMSPYGGRVEVEGPSLILTASAAQSFALALHELATNAAKYGALSNATGRVHISWSKLTWNGSDRFTFRWQEIGGPPVRPPVRNGFGSVVLGEAMTEHFDVPPRIDFSIAGVTYELIGPLDALTGNDMVQDVRDANLSQTLPR